MLNKARLAEARGRMAEGGATRGLLLLLCLAVVMPLVAEGFIPLKTLRRQHGKDVSAEGWKEAHFGGKGHHPMEHVPHHFKHRLSYHPGRSLLEGSKGGDPKVSDVQPQWQRHYHGQHHEHAKGEHEPDFTLAGEHRGHGYGHGSRRFRHGLPARVLVEEASSDDFVTPQLHHHHHDGQHLHSEAGHRGHRHARHRGFWKKLKAQLGDRVASVGAKLQSLSDGIRRRFFPSYLRLAPTIPSAAESAWVSPASSSSCGLDTKLAAMLLDITKQPYVSSESAATCAGHLEAETKSLVHNLKHELKSFCAGDLNVPCELQFCGFFDSHPKMATLIVLNKFLLHPVAFALRHDRSVCTPDELGDVYHKMKHMKRRLRHVFTQFVDELAVSDGHMEHHSGLPEADANAGAVCESCFREKHHMVLSALKQKAVDMCQQATCPKLMSACQFAKEHKHFVRTSFILKMRPWMIAAQSCAASCPTSPFPASLSGLRAPAFLDQSMQSTFRTKRGAWKELLAADAGENPQGPFHTPNGCRNLRRALQLRGFGVAELPLLSQLLDRFQNAGDQNPHTLVIELVRQGPVDLREIFEGLYQRVPLLEVQFPPLLPAGGAVQWLNPEETTSDVETEMVKSQEEYVAAGEEEKTEVANVESERNGDVALSPVYSPAAVIRGRAEI